MAKKFNFSEARDKVMIAAEKTLEQGLEQIAEQGVGEQPMSDLRAQKEDAQRQEEKPQLLLGGLSAMNEQQIRAAAEKAGRSINIELPLSLHTRLKIACASQNRKIKDIVPEIIAAWVEQVENVKA